MTDRKLAANLARDLYSDEIDYDEFLMEYPESDIDRDIDELLDLIEHHPKVGIIFGISKKENEEYLQRINEVIERLERAESDEE